MLYDRCAYLDACLTPKWCQGREEEVVTRHHPYPHYNDL